MRRIKNVLDLCQFVLALALLSVLALVHPRCAEAQVTQDCSTYNAGAGGTVGGCVLSQVNPGDVIWVCACGEGGGPVNMANLGTGFTNWNSPPIAPGSGTFPLPGLFSVSSVSVSNLQISFTVNNNQPWYVNAISWSNTDGLVHKFGSALFPDPYYSATVTNVLPNDAVALYQYGGINGTTYTFDTVPDGALVLTQAFSNPVGAPAVWGYSSLGDDISYTFGFTGTGPAPGGSGCEIVYLQP